MSKIQMYTTRFCPYCMMAKRLLNSRGCEYEEIRVDAEPERREEMLQRSGGRRTVPQIFIGEVHVGGFDDMSALDRQGGLDPLLATVTRSA